MIGRSEVVRLVAVTLALFGLLWCLSFVPEVPYVPQAGGGVGVRLSAADRGIDGGLVFLVYAACLLLVVHLATSRSDPPAVTDQDVVTELPSQDQDL